MDEATSTLECCFPTPGRRCYQQFWHYKAFDCLSHLLSTMQDADQIVVIEDGLISCQELSGRDGFCHGWNGRLALPWDIVKSRRRFVDFALHSWL